MSPDETPTEPQIDVGEAEVAPKKSMMERLAFLDKAGGSMDNVRGVNKIPRSARVIVLLVVFFLILAVILVAWPSGDNSTIPEPKTLDPAKLDDWSWSSGSTQADFVNEGGTGTHALSSLIEGNGTIFIERIDVTITWTDEPDGNIGPRQKENQPDTFKLEINSSFNVSAMSGEMSNAHGTSQTITLSADIADSGYTYLVMGNTTDLKLGDDVTMGDINIIVHMIIAGNHSSPPELLLINDLGNDYTIEISATGKNIP
jgi:hypothetical protein